MIKIFTESTIQADLTLARSSLPEDSPVAVIMKASDDYNSAFNVQTYKFSKLVQDLFADGYAVFYCKMEDADLDGALERLPLGGRRVDLLYIGAHGSPTSIHFATGESGDFFVEDVAKLRLSTLSERVYICFDSCHSGKIIAPAFQKKIPHATIWSMNAEMYGAYYVRGEIPRFLLKDDSRKLVLLHESDIRVKKKLIADFRKDPFLAPFKKMDLSDVMYLAAQGDASALYFLAQRENLSFFMRCQLLEFAHSGGDKLALHDLISHYLLLKQDDKALLLVKEIIRKGDERAYEEVVSRGFSLKARDLRFDVGDKNIRRKYLDLFRLGVFDDDLNRAAFLLAFSLIEGEIYRYTWLEEVIINLGDSFIPYIESLKSFIQGSDQVRRALYIFLKARKSDIDAELVLKLAELKRDHWPHYARGVLAFEKGDLDRAVSEFVLSDMVDGDDFIKKIAYKTEHKDACYYLYQQDPSLDYFLRAAARQGHLEAMEIMGGAL
jgi:hypothetical protein